MAIQMQIRRDSSTQWTSVNPILAEGELGVELNTGKIKVGNGINTWNDRPYITSNLETITANLQSQINYIKSNIDPAALDSLTEIVANVNALLANNVESQLVNSGFHASLTSTGNLILDGSLLPNLHISQDLGSPTKAWRSLFLSSSTAYFGNAALTITSNGLQVLDAANQPLPIIANIQFPDGSSLTSASGGGGASNKLVSGNIEVVLTGGADPYVTFPEISTGEQLFIQGSEVAAATGNLVLTSRGDAYVISNGEGIGGASFLWNFNSQGNLVLPPGGDILNQNGNSVLGGSPTGNLIIGDSAINFVASSSGDGYSLSTIELVPDNNAYGNGQFLIVDPTYPNHIHIRAGGPMDNSQTNLILGGEKLRTEVRDYDNTAGIYNETVVNISNTTFYANSANFTTATFTGDSTSGYISLTVVSQEVLNKIWALNSVSRIQLYDGMNSFTVKPDGNTGTPGVGQTANFGIVKVEPSDSLPSNGSTFTEVSFDIKQLIDTKIEVDGSDIRIEAADDVRIYSRDVFMLANYGIGSPVRIVTKYNTENTEWEFRADGNLQLPQTDMMASPQPASYPGITFTDGTHQITAFTGTEFPTNIVNTHNNSSVIFVGGTGASSESLSVRLINDNNALGIEVNYSSANPTTISAFRAYPYPTNIYTGTNSKLAPNTDWDNFGNIATVGDSMSFTVTDHGFHKIYRVLVIARSIPGGGPGVGDAYCVIEKLKL